MISKDRSKTTKGRKGSKPVNAYKHQNNRKNLPTDQTSRTMSSKDAKPVPYKLPPKNPGTLSKDRHPPHLQWDRNFPDTTAAGPLYIHEKLHPAAFAESLKRHRVTLDAFGPKYDGLPAGAEFQWYKHRGRWQNRIIRGESRHVMASLLVKEGMAGKVQMIYFDPPYGINFRNVLQANIDNNKYKGKIPNDPVAVQTFRDTYSNGIHSYLDNIYMIASHARELLNDTGSFFLQISSTNLNLVGVVLDEVFNAENRMGIIPFAKTSSSSAKGLPDVTNYLLWYAKNKGQAKYNQLYEETPTRKDLLELMSSYAMVELKDGQSRKLEPEERKDPEKIPSDAKLFQHFPPLSQGYDKTRSKPYEWNGKVWKCPHNMQWSVSHDGLDRMASANRLVETASLRWKKYESEIPGRKYNNLWSRKAYAQDQHYVVETAESTIKQCMLMTTDPGDLVFDPTCGSGTTAYVAESWGRRWITSDAGLVAVNLARQRIITGVFPWYMLIDSDAGYRRESELREKANQPPLQKETHGEDPSKGFVYRRLPHVSAKFLAYPDLQTEIDYIVDSPEKERGRLRVSSPFTVESTSPYRYVDPKQPAVNTATRQNVISALRDAGIRIGDSNVHLTDLEEYPGKTVTHTATFDGKKACIMVASDDCTVPPVMVDHAVEEAAAMPSVGALIVVAFAYEPSVRNERRGRLDIYKTMANQDLQIGNLKDEKNDIAFVLVGEPDVRIEAKGDQITAEVVGYDTFDPASGNTRSVNLDKEATRHDVYCWMIDTDYDGRSFFAKRVHFPGSAKDRQILNFYKKMESRIEQELWDAALSLKSAPFKIPESGRIAVKIITATHSEMTTVIDVKSPRP